MNRRAFVRTSAVLPVGMAWPAARRKPASPPPSDVRHLKLSCNLYSFNEPLQSGAMTLEEVLAFCSDLGFAAVDPTGYYLTGYPEPPSEAYINRIKRDAFLLGLDISGTGVRNDFTLAGDAERQAEIEHAKRWIEVAAQLGAPVLRVFAGKALPDGQSREAATERLVESLRTVAEYGAQYGVMPVLQNHADFLLTAAQVEDVLKQVGSEWLGLMLDIGSLGGPDPYEEIAVLAPYAVTWQIKEEVTVTGEKAKTDLDRIIAIAIEAGYRGYLPLETLGPGDPREKVPRFLADVRQALADA